MTTEPCELSAVEARRLIGRKALMLMELLESGKPCEDDCALRH